MSYEVKYKGEARWIPITGRNLRIALSTSYHDVDAAKREVDAGATVATEFGEYRKVSGLKGFWRKS